MIDTQRAGLALVWQGRAFKSRIREKRHLPCANARVLSLTQSRIARLVGHARAAYMRRWIQACLASLAHGAAWRAWR
jgi:hypothetical protein